jgi:hypothetical protein
MAKHTIDLAAVLAEFSTLTTLAESYEGLCTSDDAVERKHNTDFDKQYRREQAEVNKDLLFMSHLADQIKVRCAAIYWERRGYASVGSVRRTAVTAIAR